MEVSPQKIDFQVGDLLKSPENGILIFVIGKYGSFPNHTELGYHYVVSYPKYNQTSLMSQRDLSSFIINQKWIHYKVK